METLTFISENADAIVGVVVALGYATVAFCHFRGFFEVGRFSY